MADREKVIKGLECCTHGVAQCPICPYDPRNNALPVDCMSGLAKDALELLKAQEPRVLTLDEALEADVCWLEKKGDDRVWPCKVGGGEKWAVVWRFDQEPIAVPRDEYGKLFRCWSARPTEEQREAVKWDG